MASKVYRVQGDLTPNTLLLLTADYMGIRPQIDQVLEDVGDMRPLKRSTGLASLLKTARAENKLSRQDVFDRCNISLSQLSFYENGAQKNPGMRTVQALAYGYKLTFVDVLAAVMFDVHPRETPKRRKTQDGN